METTRLKKQLEDRRLRDEAAMRAMAALIGLGLGVQASEMCWQYADAFMAERERRGARNKEG